MSNVLKGRVLRIFVLEEGTQDDASAVWEEQARQLGADVVGWKKGSGRRVTTIVWGGGPARELARVIRDSPRATVVRPSWLMHCLSEGHAPAETAFAVDINRALAGDSVRIRRTDLDRELPDASEARFHTSQLDDDELDRLEEAQKSRKKRSRSKVGQAIVSRAKKQSAAIAEEEEEEDLEGEEDFEGKEDFEGEDDFEGEAEKMKSSSASKSKSSSASKSKSSSASKSKSSSASKSKSSSASKSKSSPPSKSSSSPAPKSTTASKSKRKTTSKSSEAPSVVECTVVWDSSAVGRGDKTKLRNRLRRVAGVREARDGEMATHLVVGEPVRRTIKTLGALARGASIVSFSSGWSGEEEVTQAMFPKGIPALDSGRTFKAPLLEGDVIAIGRQGPKEMPVVDLTSIAEQAGAQVRLEDENADILLVGDGIASTAAKAALRSHEFVVRTTWLLDSIWQGVRLDPEDYRRKGDDDGISSRASFAEAQDEKPPKKSSSSSSSATSATKKSKKPPPKKKSPPKKKAPAKKSTAGTKRARASSRTEEPEEPEEEVLDESTALDAAPPLETHQRKQRRKDGSKKHQEEEEDFVGEVDEGEEEEDEEVMPKRGRGRKQRTSATKPQKEEQEEEEEDFVGEVDEGEEEEDEEVVPKRGRGRKQRTSATKPQKVEQEEERDLLEETAMEIEPEEHRRSSPEQQEVEEVPKRGRGRGRKQETAAGRRGRGKSEDVEGVEEKSASSSRSSREKKPGKIRSPPEDEDAEEREEDEEEEEGEKTVTPKPQASRATQSSTKDGGFVSPTGETARLEDVENMEREEEVEEDVERVSSNRDASGVGGDTEPIEGDTDVEDYMEEEEEEKKEESKSAKKSKVEAVAAGSKRPGLGKSASDGKRRRLDSSSASLSSAGDKSSSKKAEMDRAQRSQSLQGMYPLVPSAEDDCSAADAAAYAAQRAVKELSSAEEVGEDVVSSGAKGGRRIRGRAKQETAAQTPNKSVDISSPPQSPPRSSNPVTPSSTAIPPTRFQKSGAKHRLSPSNTMATTDSVRNAATNAATRLGPLSGGAFPSVVSPDVRSNYRRSSILFDYGDADNNNNNDESNRDGSQTLHDSNTNSTATHNREESAAHRDAMRARTKKTLGGRRRRVLERSESTVTSATKYALPRTDIGPTNSKPQASAESSSNQRSVSLSQDAETAERPPQAQGSFLQPDGTLGGPSPSPRLPPNSGDTATTKINSQPPPKSRIEDDAFGLSPED